MSVPCTKVAVGTSPTKKTILKKNFVVTTPTKDTVSGWFKQAWPGHSYYPGPANCEYVATAIHNIKIAELNRQLNHNSAREAREDKIISYARESAQVFLKRTPALLDLLQCKLNDWAETVAIAEQLSEPLRENLPDYARLLDVFDAANQAVKALNIICEIAPTLTSRPIRVADRPLWIKKHVEEAWRRTQKPTSRSALVPQQPAKILRLSNANEGPLVAFIQWHSKISATSETTLRLARRFNAQKERTKQLRLRVLDASSNVRDRSPQHQGVSEV